MLSFIIGRLPSKVALCIEMNEKVREILKESTLSIRRI